MAGPYILSRLPAVAPIKPEHVARGQEAEAHFQAWLEASRFPYFYIDQSVSTFARHLRGDLKRPDYFVGIRGVGLIGFDVKAKTVYRGALIFDAEEIRRLANFGILFNVSVYFACLKPRGSGAWWAWVPELALRAPATHQRGVISMPVRELQSVSFRTPFDVALVDALRR